MTPLLLAHIILVFRGELEVELCSKLHRTGIVREVQLLLVELRCCDVDEVARTGSR